MAEAANVVRKKLISAHFPEAGREARRASPVPMARRYDWAKAMKIVFLERLRWATNTFEPLKAPASDEIHPAFLQKSKRVLAIPFCKLLRACLAVA